VLQVRAFVNQVRSGEAKPVDVEAAVTRLADEFQKQTGIVVELKIEAMREGSGEALLGLVLMVGEALQNIHKHAGATKTRVTIGFADGAVTAAVDDDGTGFPFGGTYTLDDLELMGIGPVSIRRRVRELGGELSVESRPGRGSTLRIRVPA
jgi:signal transduction histidine kinase